MGIFRKKFWFLIFAICFIYWGYLILNAKMLIASDSAMYENAGKLIYQNGWLDFFRTGTHREPLYPALITLSMALAKLLSIDYQFILKVFQVAFLFSTQVFLIFLLRKINVREGIIKVAVLYCGVSPAVINGTFSLFYEIVSFPFVLAAVLLAGSLWPDIKQARSFRLILGKTALFGACFSLLALGRGVFQYVFYFFILPFCIAAIFAFFNRQKLILQRLLIFISVSFAIFYSSTSYIKTMNLRYNGHYILCETHSSILLGSAYKRSQPISLRIIASHIASIPGTGVCRMFFSQGECDYADWYGSDKFRVTKAAQALAVIPEDRQQQEVYRLTFEKIADHPFQYLFFSVVESLKMPFWESTQIGFVGYPESLTRFYNHPLARFGLRLLLGLMTIAAFVFVTFSLWRTKHQSLSILFFVWLMIVSYTLFYSSCYVVTRFSLPIASIYIACIAFTINALIRRNSGNSYGQDK